MPKLIIKPYGYSTGKVCELEQANNLNYKEIVLIDGRRVQSYDELLEVVAQDNYKNSELIEIVVLPAISGG